jgi:hypothetical protein
VFCSNLLIDSFKSIVFHPTKYSPEESLKIESEEGIYHATIDLDFVDYFLEDLDKLWPV